MSLNFLLESIENDNKRKSEITDSQSQSLLTKILK